MTRNEAEQLKFADWCQQKAETCQFLYWSTVLQLELKVLCTCAVCTKHCLPRTWMPWFHALDHTNYWRWIPVHLRDMVEMPMTP